MRRNLMTDNRHKRTLWIRQNRVVWEGVMQIKTILAVSVYSAIRASTASDLNDARGNECTL
jgi:hypothetical protein